MLTPIKYQNQKIKLIIFDWDGTLLDSLSPLTESFIETCKDMDLNKPTINDIRQSFGHKPEQIIYQFFPEESTKNKDFTLIFTTKFRNFYQKKSAKLFPGSKLVLERLSQKGYKLAIATNKTRPLLEKELGETAVESLISMSQTPSEQPAKPNPSMLTHIVNAHGLHAENCLMVGDHENDILAAKAAHIPVVVIAENSSTAEKLTYHQPHAIISSIENLPDWVQQDLTIQA